MKKTILKTFSLIFILFISMCIYIIYSFFFISPKFELEEFAEFNQEEFTQEKWNNAIDDEQKRGEMLYSFFKKNNIVNIKRNEIINLLGEPTYYYLDEIFPAYRIQHNGNKYVLVFSINRETRLIYDADLEDPLEKTDLKDRY